MRHLCKSIFLAVVVLLAALPHLLADSKSDVQVQLDVVVMTCSRDALAGTAMKSLDSVHWQVLSGQEYADLFAAVRGHKATKIVAEPKIVAISGRPAVFQSNGQHVGLELKVLPVALANGRIYLELNPRIETVKGAVHDEQTIRTALEIESGATVGFTLPADISGSRDKKMVTLILATPGAVREPARMPISAAVPETQSDRLKKMAAMLAEEYRAACEAHDSALAAKLARLALELNPKCFHPTPSQVPSVLPVVAVPPPPADSSEEAEPMKADYRVPMMPPIKDAEPLPPCTEQPSEAEILRSLPNVSHEDVEIVCEKLADPAQLHNCHWKCTVHFTDSKTKRKRCEVIYINKDVLHGTAAEPSEKPTAVPAAKPTGTKVGGWLKRIWPSTYDSDPNVRMRQMINQSEDMRQVAEEWKQIWFTDQPSEIASDRVQAGIK